MDIPEKTRVLDYERRGPIVAQHSTFAMWLNWLLRPPLFLLATFILSGIVWFMLALLMPLMTYAGPLLTFAGLLIAARSMRRIRQARASAVLAHLEQIVRTNLPLAQMLEAASLAERGATSQRLRHMARSITQGYSIAQSLAAWVPEISSGIIATIDAGERSGKLQLVLARLVNADGNVVSSQERISNSFGYVYMWYPLLMIPVLISADFCCASSNSG